MEDLDLQRRTAHVLLNPSDLIGDELKENASHKRFITTPYHPYKLQIQFWVSGDSKPRFYGDQSRYSYDSEDIIRVFQLKRELNDEGSYDGESGDYKGDVTRAIVWLS